MQQRRPIIHTTVRVAPFTVFVGAVLALTITACGPGPSDGAPTPTGDISIAVTVIGDGRATLGALGFTCSDSCTLVVDEGTAVSLAAVPNAGRVLVAWDGPCGPFDDACVWHADAGAAVTVTFAPHALRFDLAGDGEGYFAIDAAGDVTECRGACGVALQQPLQVTIQYYGEGATRTTLDPWTGTCADEADTYCLVHVEGATTIGKTWRHPPIATDFQASVDQASRLTVEAPGVLADVDDTPGDTHTASPVSEPEHGSLELSGNGSFTYEPNAGFVGIDQFTFRVTDAFGNTDDATANVSVRPRLTLTKQGDGSVSSDPTGIACDTSCTTDEAHFDLGSSVTLTAEAQSGNTFRRWSGEPCDGSSDPTCVVTMSGPTSITAIFATSNHTLVVSRSGNGRGNVTSSPSAINLNAGNDSAIFVHGTEITLTANPTGLSVFAAWSTGPCAGSGSATCSFTITDDTIVDATFNLKRPLIGVGDAGYGTAAWDPARVDRDGATPAAFDHGTDAPLTVVTDLVSPIDAWSNAHAPRP